MSETLKLPSRLYKRLKDGADQRGMSVVSMVEYLTEIVAKPLSIKRRNERIENMFSTGRRRSLTPRETAELDRLISADYQAANEAADRRIARKTPGSQKLKIRGVDVATKEKSRSRKSVRP